MPTPLHPFQIADIRVGEGKLFLVAGPCVLESETHAHSLADSIQRIAAELGIPYIFKASYDKANRTSLASYRGPGLVHGARILREIARTNGLPVLTDVHTPEECRHLSDLMGDAELVLQIPAFLCRQTDLLLAAAATGRAINIKKGQFVAPSDMRHAVDKVRASGNPRVSLCERGACFGYNNLVVDMRGLPVMRGFAPVLFDATHAVQQPSSGEGISGGQPEFIPVLARAAVAAGIDGLFLETHDNPAQAKSDGANALPLGQLQGLLATLLRIHQSAHPADASLL